MEDQIESILLFALKQSTIGNELIESFRKKGSHLLVTGTGEETIQVFNQHLKIALILIPIDLQGLDAFETVNKIRQSDASVPVILLSNFVTVHTIRLAIGIGCNEILQTPVSPFTLEEILLKYLHN
ncbi:MAG: response regulator [Bacteroidales bacterium]|jgi:CheY-like chemotaxis protein